MVRQNIILFNKAISGKVLLILQINTDTYIIVVGIMMTCLI